MLYWEQGKEYRVQGRDYKAMNSFNPANKRIYSHYEKQIKDMPKPSERNKAKLLNIMKEETLRESNF